MLFLCNVDVVRLCHVISTNIIFTEDRKFLHSSVERTSPLDGEGIIFFFNRSPGFDSNRSLGLGRQSGLWP